VGGVFDLLHLLFGEIAHGLPHLLPATATNSSRDDLAGGRFE